MSLGELALRAGIDCIRSVDPPGRVSMYDSHFSLEKSILLARIENSRAAGKLQKEVGIAMGTAKHPNIDFGAS